MNYDHVAYSRRVDEILLDAGATGERYGEVDGYELMAYRLFKSGPLGKSLPLVYISTGMHGDEPAGPESLLRLLENGLLNRELSFYICPMLNPTGFQRGTRENLVGRDLNRDYYTLRNVEVKEHVKWLEKQFEIQVPELFVSLHEDWESEGFYFYEINLIDDEVKSLERYQEIAKKIEAVMPMEPSELIDDHQIRELGWIYHCAEADMEKKWPEAIFIAKHGCSRSFTFESPSSKNIKHRVTTQVTAVNSLLDYLFE